jgi:uncharacterized protein YprB with RNaseH-like and TPR domain
LPESAKESPNAALPKILTDGGWRITEDNIFARTVRHRFVSETGTSGDTFPAKLSSQLELFFPREAALFTDKDGHPLHPSLEDFRFFDIETTGLSRGAGTVAFMLCAGRFEAEDFIVDQLILPDYDREADFLSAVTRLLGASPQITLISFNGKCFDSQILQTRYLMNGVRPPLAFSGTGEVHHLDLLYPSRRLWGKLFGSCRLSVLEEQLLGDPRKDDLPGSMAPEAWFSWLRTGDAEMLFKVGEHNRDDCITMPRILTRLNRLALLGAALTRAAENPLAENALLTDPVDYHSLGTLFLASGRHRGDPQRLHTGEILLRKAVTEQHNPLSALLLAAHLRRNGLWQEAEPLLLPLAEQGNKKALLMLAIDAEHRKRDYQQALSFVQKLDSSDEDTIKRMERLTRLTAE